MGEPNRKSLPSRVVASYTPKLKKILRKNGCSLHRQGKGDHEIWFSPINSCCFTVDNDIKSKHTANKSLKDAGLPKEF